MLLYSLMRFGLSYLRVDSREIIFDLTTPQVTALVLIPDQRHRDHLVPDAKASRRAWRNSPPGPCSSCGSTAS